MSGHTVPVTPLLADHVAIRVPDFTESVQWYEQKLGFHLVNHWHEGAIEAAYLERNGFRIEILAGGSPPQAGGTPTNVEEHLQMQGWRHLCFRVDNVEQIITELKRQGVSVIAEPSDHPPIRRKIGLILDNNANVIEFAQPYPEEKHATKRT